MGWGFFCLFAGRGSFPPPGGHFPLGGGTQSFTEVGVFNAANKYLNAASILMVKFVFFHESPGPLARLEVTKVHRSGE